MKHGISLSILDQSPIVHGRTAAQALCESIDLVQYAEQLGYKRYWFAEHHASASFASASPEIMMAYAAAKTSTIRLGSGSILLGQAQPLRIAEHIRTLHALAPSRIDAGFGRAPGGDARVSQALGYAPNQTWQRLDDVVAMLRNQSVPRNVGQVVATPDGVEVPEIWVQGTSIESARMAAERGLNYAFGAFIDPTNMEAAISEYYTHARHADAKTLIATIAFVGETEQTAAQIAQCSEHWFVQSFLRSMNVRFPTTIDVTPTAMEHMIVELRKRESLIGTPAHVWQRLQEMSKRYATTEFALVTITANHADRKESYRLLAE